MHILGRRASAYASFFFCDCAEVLGKSIKNVKNEHLGSLFEKK